MLLQIYILQGDKNWQGGPVLATKLVWPDQFWQQNWSPHTICLAGLILVGTNFIITDTITVTMNNGT